MSNVLKHERRLFADLTYSPDDGAWYYVTYDRHGETVEESGLFADRFDAVKQIADRNAQIININN